MIEALIQILIILAVVVVVLWAVRAILSAAGIPVPQVVWIVAAAIIALIILLYVARAVGVALP